MTGKRRFAGFVLIACIFALQSNGQAQDRKIPPPDELEFSQQRLLTVWDDFRKNLEKEFQNSSKELDVTLRQQMGEVDSKIVEMANRIERMRQSEDDRELRLREDHLLIKTTMTFLGITSIGCIAGFWIFIIGKFRWIANERIPKLAEEKSNQILGEHFSRERDKIVRLIQAHDKELQLKRTKRILVLTQAGSDLAFFEKFFLQQGFDQCRFEVFDPETDVEGRDLVLFDNEKATLQAEEIREYFVRKFPSHTIAFYFGKGYIPNPEQNFAFANSRVQLYGNLINSLKYQSLLV